MHKLCCDEQREQLSKVQLNNSATAAEAAARTGAGREQT